MLKSDKPIVVTQSFAVARSLVWQAITNVPEMQKWFFEEISDFEPTVGFETEFSIPHEGKTYTHVWKVLEATPEETLVCDWTYKGVVGRGRVTWELSDEKDKGDGDDQTLLTLTSQAIESFPQDDPAFHRESALEGWKFLIHELLPEHLEAGN